MPLYAITAGGYEYSHALYARPLLYSRIHTDDPSRWRQNYPWQRATSQRGWPYFSMDSSACLPILAAAAMSPWEPIVRVGEYDPVLRSSSLLSSSSRATLSHKAHTQTTAKASARETAEHCTYNQIHSRGTPRCTPHVTLQYPPHTFASIDWTPVRHLATPADSRLTLGR